MDGAFLVLILIVIYFLPAMIAQRRGHQSDTAIFVLNLFLGWTFLGWVIALVWACTSNTKANAENNAAMVARMIEDGGLRNRRDAPQQDGPTSNASGYARLAAHEEAMRQVRAANVAEDLAREEARRTLRNP